MAVYECWIKPPNGEWLNYTQIYDFSYNLSSTVSQCDVDLDLVPRGYCVSEGFVYELFFEKGYKMQWRTRADKKWRDREEKRMSRKNRKDMYELLPKEWTKLEPIVDHYAHLSCDRDEDCPDLIAYTISVEKGEQDVQTKIKAGKYLKKYYPKLTNEDIRYYSEAVQALLSSVTITDDPIEATKVYQNGPDSCMKRSMDHFDYPEELTEIGVHHPVAAYFAGDLKLAYLGTVSAPTARCIVWPDKKLYGRIYGAKTRMVHALQRMGYVDDYLDGRTFVGARMKIIEIEEGEIVWPYIDGMQNPYIKEEDTNNVYIGPKRDLPKDVEWGQTNICGSEEGRSSFKNPFLLYCALSGMHIKDGNEVGYLSENRPALIEQLKQLEYELLEGEKYWLPKHRIVFYVDEKGHYKKIDRRYCISNIVYCGNRNGYDCICDVKDTIKLCDNTYAHKTETENTVNYKGRKYRNLEHLYIIFPSLNPGRFMFNGPLNERQMERLGSLIYRYEVADIIRLGILGREYVSQYYGETA